MLTDTAIRNAKPREKPYKLAGGGGLYLLINPSGARWWRLKYRVGDKEKLLSLGVPLSRQAVAILRDLHAVTGDGKYLFPSVRSTTRPMSDNTLNAALRRLGYTTNDMTAHGFRSMASTLLNEQGCWNRDAIERQLAHGERDEVRAANNYAEYLPERRRMMQVWSDHLDGLRAGASVIPIKRAG